MKSDIVLAMLICSLFLRDVPMDFREKVILCILIMKYIDTYIKTEADLIWVNKQIKKMESEFNNVAGGSDTIEWDRTSDDEIRKTI